MIFPRVPPTLDSVADHYDVLDEFYREIWGEHVHHGFWETGGESPEAATRALVSLVAQEALIKSGDHVCDVGCGYGATARMLARDYGTHVTALTISPAQHAFARALDPAAHNPVYLLRDWLSNDLPDAAFDAVIAIESSEHMADKAAFFAQARRVLKPGGRLVVCAWLARSNPRPWEVRLLLEPICREGRLPGLGTDDDYERLARDAGFPFFGFRDISRHVKRTWPICVARGLKGLLLRPRYRRFLFASKNPDRIFALTLFRMWLAYEVRSMRYGVMTAYEPPKKPSVHWPGARARTETEHEAAGWTVER
jgi:tocopherol O-methyltransferase